MTIRKLYNYAVANGFEDATLRIESICDDSYYDNELEPEPEDINVSDDKKQAIITLVTWN